MLKLSKSIPVLLSSAIVLGAASFAAHAGEVQSTHVVKPAHAALFELGTKKVAATYVDKDGKCDVVISVADLPDADGNATGWPTRISTPVAGGAQTRVYISEGYAVEASCALSAKLLTVRPIAFTAAAQ